MLSLALKKQSSLADVPCDTKRKWRGPLGRAQDSCRTEPQVFLILGEGGMVGALYLAARYVRGTFSFWGGGDADFLGHYFKG